MKLGMFLINVPISDAIGLPGGEILRSFAKVIMLFMLWSCNRFPCSVRN